jgi:hypothetical protein
MDKYGSEEGPETGFSEHGNGPVGSVNGGNC